MFYEDPSNFNLWDALFGPESILDEKEQLLYGYIVYYYGYSSVAQVTGVYPADYNSHMLELEELAFGAGSILTKEEQGILAQEIAETAIKLLAMGGINISAPKVGLE